MEINKSKKHMRKNKLCLSYVKKQVTLWPPEFQEQVHI